MNPGAAVALNNNDSNENDIEDLNAVDNGLSTPDPDLRKYTVRKLSPDDLFGTFVSSIPGQGAGGSFRLWGAATKTGTLYEPGMGFPEDSVNSGLPVDRWVEGITPTTLPGATYIHGYLKNQGYTKSGLKTVEDRINVSVFGVLVEVEEEDINADGDLLFSRGLTVCANVDDDDGNVHDDYNNNPTGQDDKLENSTQDDELYEIRFVAPVPLDANEFQVTLPAGWEAFEDRGKQTQIAAITGPVSLAGKTVYVEADSLSSALKDKTITTTINYQGQVFVHTFEATVGVVCGPQYVTQLSRWRYEVLFPAADGNPEFEAECGTVSAVPGSPRQRQIEYGDLSSATQNLLTFTFPSGRALHWRTDVFILEVDTGTATANSAPLEAGPAPYFDGLQGNDNDFHLHSGAPAGSSAITMRFEFSATSPRPGNKSPGGQNISIGFVQNVKVEELESVFRASSGGSPQVPEGTTLYNHSIIDKTRCWFWDTIVNSYTFYSDPDSATLEYDTATSAISGSCEAYDRPGAYVPILCQRIVTFPDPEYQDGEMSSNPSAGDDPPEHFGSIKSTSIINDFRVWVAVTMSQPPIHNSSSVFSWNLEQYWAHTKAFWRMRVDGTNMNAGWDWKFSSSPGAHHGNTCDATDGSAHASSLCTWTQCETVTAPTKKKDGDNANTTLLQLQRDGNWEGKQ